MAGGIWRSPVRRSRAQNDEQMAREEWGAHHELIGNKRDVRDGLQRWVVDGDGGWRRSNGAVRDKPGQNKDKTSNWRHLCLREITTKLGESSASRSEARVQENHGGGDWRVRVEDGRGKGCSVELYRLGNARKRKGSREIGRD